MGTVAELPKVRKVKTGDVASKLIALTLVTFIVCLFALGYVSSATAQTYLEEDEQEMVDLINQERLAHRLPSLQISLNLTKMARQHSYEMVELDYFSHESPENGDVLERIENADVGNWVTAGENIAGAYDIEVAFKALMKSEEHRENILNPDFTHVGVGVVKGGRYGLMITQEFVEVAEETVIVSEASAAKEGKGFRISFNLTEPAWVTVGIYNSQGDLVERIVENDLRQAGLSCVVWDGEVSEEDASEGKAEGKYEYRVLAKSVEHSDSMFKAGVVSVGSQIVEAKKTRSLFTIIAEFFSNLFA